MEPTLREQLKMIIREVLVEELEMTVRNSNERQQERESRYPKGRVTDPENDRRLKQNRGKDIEEDIDRHYIPNRQV